VKQQASAPGGFDVSWLGYLGFLGFLRYLWEPAGVFSLLFLFFLVPMIRSFSASPRTGSRAASGRRRLTLTRCYALAILASVCNPFTLVQSVTHLLGQLAGLLRTAGALPEPGVYRQKSTLHLPFEGWWLVARGGLDQTTSHSWDIVNQRFAFDFVPVGERGSAQDTGEARLQDFRAFGQPILAPGPGRVVRVRDGVRDYHRPGSGLIDWLTPDFRGNHVVIRHAEGEYSFLGHLMKGSIRVRVGDELSSGDVVARCGNSGHTTQPHLHYHLMDRANFFFAVSLPVQFSDFDVVEQGSAPRRVTRGYIASGQEVSRSPGSAITTDDIRRAEAPSPTGRPPRPRG